MTTDSRTARRPHRPVDRRLLRDVAVRRAIVTSVVCGLLSAAAVVVQALALAGLLAGAMGSRQVDAFSTVLWISSAALVRAVCALVAELAGAHGAEAAKAALRSSLLAAVVAAGSRRSASAGEIATVAGRGIDALDPYIGRCLPDLVLAAAVPLSLTVVIGALDWISGVVIAAALVLFPVFGVLVGAGSNDLARKRWRQVEVFGRVIGDVFEGLPLLKALGQSSRQRERIAMAGQALRDASLATLRVAFLSALVLDTLASVSVALVAVPLGIRLLSGSVSIAAALAVLIVAPEVFVPLRRATAEFHESTEGLAAAHSALETIECAEVELPRQPRRVMPDPRDAPVSFDEVRVERTGRVVLDRATLALGPGEHVVVIGANGAGKSTAIDLLLGFLTPTQGSVRIGGCDLRTADLDAWREHIGYLPEHPTLLAASLAENLRLAQRGASTDDMARALADANAMPLLTSLPAGLETRLGDGGRAVSAGERQRIALSRIFLRDASLYLLDEPTAHLDAANEAAIIDALERRLCGRTALIVTHSPAALRLGDRVLALDGGRFVPVRKSAVQRARLAVTVPA